MAWCAQELYWTKRSVWNNQKDTAILLDASGDEVHRRHAELQPVAEHIVGPVPSTDSTDDDSGDGSDGGSEADASTAMVGTGA
eukprot:SAG22_NODE_230_length_14595_cov_50.767660_5_plen_83_part_00